MKSRSSFLRRMSVSAAFALFAGCQFFTGPKITDEIVDKYVKAYTGLRQIGPELAEKMKNAQGREVDIDPGMQGYAQIEKIIKDAGFKDYKEFVQVNAKIGLAFSQMEGRTFMDQMDKMHSIGYEEIDKQLADPQVPEEVKAELRKTRAQLEENMAKNKPWAEGVMKGASILSDKETLEVIQRNREKIRSAYTGGIPEPAREFMGRKL